MSSSLAYSFWSLSVVQEQYLLPEIEGQLVLTGCCIYMTQYKKMILRCDECNCRTRFLVQILIPDYYLFFSLQILLNICLKFKSCTDVVVNRLGKTCSKWPKSGRKPQNERWKQVSWRDMKYVCNIFFFSIFNQIAWKNTE